MNNNIAYSKGAIVCIRKRYTTPLGECITAYIDIRPLLVIDIIPDKEYANRVGDIGSANKYVLEDIIYGGTLSRYQYELCLWETVRQDVISYREEELQKLKNI